jgi:hypothetical protein
MGWALKKAGLPAHRKTCLDIHGSWGYFFLPFAISMALVMASFT